MSTFNESTIEPKNIFLGLLIERLGTIANVIYDQKELRTGLTMMLSLIDMLDENSQTSLKEQREKITTMQEGRLDKVTVYNIFSTISIYLHKTYLQEVSTGLVPTSTLKTETDKPKHEALDPHQTSRL